MRRIILTGLLQFAILTIMAQNGLYIAPLFEGRIIPQERMVETRVKGKMLSEYQLSLFHSVSFSGTLEESQTVFALVEKEKKDLLAASHQSKRVRTLMLQLPPSEGKNRFLCYKSKQSGKTCDVTVIYIEGRLASLDELINIFNMK